MPSNNLTDLQGQIERITFTSEETGYTVAKVKVYGRRELVTILGNIINPTPGEIIKMKGEWGNHPNMANNSKLSSVRRPLLPVFMGLKVSRIRARQGHWSGHGQADR